MSIRTVVGDDDEGFRAAVVDVLEADPRFAVVGVAADGAELVKMAATTTPDLVVLDVRMPSGGADAARQLTGVDDDPRRAGPRPLVVALSADTAPEIVASMLEAGAVGFLAKGKLGGTLPDLLARVADGEVVVAVPTGVHALRHLLSHQRGPVTSQASSSVSSRGDLADPGAAPEVP